jgi:hypothetical protein
MKKIVSIALGAAAILALSGCNSAGGGPNGGHDGKIKIQRQASEYVEMPNNQNQTCTEIKNNPSSDYDLYDIWSAPVDGTYSHIFPNNTPPNTIEPGEKRTFCSANCGADTWKIKVQDERHYIAEGKYQRECGYKELLVVTTKY